MIWCKLYLDTFLRDTDGMNTTERGAYISLFVNYYVKETPLPSDIKALYAIAKASSPQEREAVRNVLHLFPDCDGKRFNRQIDAGIAAYHAVSANKADAARKREAEKRANVLEFKGKP